MNGFIILVLIVYKRCTKVALLTPTFGLPKNFTFLAITNKLSENYFVYYTFYILSHEATSTYNFVRPSVR